MNEFIVWDKEKHIFVPQGEIIFSFYGDNKIVVTPNCIESMGDTCHDNYNENRFNIFNHIGLKDINNKKIYADSSICRVNYFSSSDWISDYCYFSFDDENLRYTVHLINEREIVDYESSCFDCIEIVDTIQENKLGLIK